MWEDTRRTFVESSERILRAIARLVPTLAAMVLILLVAAAVAGAVRLVVRRVCLRLELDRRLREWGVAQPAAAGRREPSDAISRLLGWSVLALGFVLGLGTVEATATSVLAMRMLEYLPHVVVALLILAGGLAGSRALERSVLIGAVSMGMQSARLLGLGTRGLVVTVAAAMALEHLGVGGTILPVAFGILFGGMVLALALAIGLGAKDVVARSLERRFQERGAKGDAPAAPDDLKHL
jgi:hypothetical protein